jgi:hypothetical protein
MCSQTIQRHLRALPYLDLAAVSGIALLAPHLRSAQNDTYLVVWYMIRVPNSSRAEGHRDACTAHS